MDAGEHGGEVVVALVPPPPHELREVGGEQGLRCPKLALQFSLEQHLVVLDVVRVNVRVLRVDVMVLVDDHVVRVDTVGDLVDVGV